MRTIIIVLSLAGFLLCPGAAFSDSEGKFGGALKVGVDFSGEWQTSFLMASTERDVDNGASFAAEGYYRASKNLDVGLGIQYLPERKLKNKDTDVIRGHAFWFAPVYAVVRVHPEVKNNAPYLTAQLGYSNHGGNSVYTGQGQADYERDVYWGVGAGYIFQRHFLAEILYSESSADVTSSGVDGDIDYKRVTLSLGYNF